MNRDEIEAALARHAALIRTREGGGAPQVPIRPREAEPNSLPLVRLMMTVLMGVLALALLAWAAWN
jgi:hypothetical protein